MMTMSMTLSGCGSDASLFTVVFGGGSNEIIGTMTISEFDLKVNRLLTEIFNDSETHLSNSKYVVNGSMDANEEYALVQSTINNVQDTIDEINKLAEPSRRTDAKTEIILNLTSYKNALIEYALSLQNGNSDNIKSSANSIMVTMETLKGSWQTYTE